MKKEPLHPHPVTPENLRAELEDYVRRLDEAERIADALAQDPQHAAMRENGPGPAGKRPAAAKRLFRLAAVAASLLLVAGLGAGLSNRLQAPKDTFDDPYLAYAAVEEALNRISSSAGKGIALEREGESKLQESFTVFHR